MTRALLDTNVILDVLLKRGEWLADAEAVRQANLGGRLEGCITASSLTDIYYLARKIVGRPSALEMVRDCLSVYTVLPVDRDALDHAVRLAADDFEDALQLACAERHGLDAIVTRDAAGFAGSRIPVLAPQELIARLKAGSITGRTPEGR